jgi:orotidine-5'-phosphate decarboxylase
MQPETNDNPLIVGLDVPTAVAAEELVAALCGAVGAFKVGLELFNAEGPGIFARLQRAGGGAMRIFYDAKLHDIPNTVAGAMRAASKHGLWMINVHASGGAQMMRAAVEAAGAAETRPLVIAVTVLTSIDTSMLNDDLGVAADATTQVVRLAKLAQDAGCDGVVASPLEVHAIRLACGPEFVIVTPGVRPAGAAVGDQKRVMIPADAVRTGSNYLVIGRPITQAKEPRKAAESILEEIGQRE